MRRSNQTPPELQAAGAPLSKGPKHPFVSGKRSTHLARCDTPSTVLLQQRENGFGHEMQLGQMQSNSRSREASTECLHARFPAKEKKRDGEGFVLVTASSRHAVHRRLGLRQVRALLLFLRSCAVTIEGYHRPKIGTSTLQSATTAPRASHYRQLVLGACVPTPQHRTRYACSSSWLDEDVMVEVVMAASGIRSSQVVADQKTSRGVHHGIWLDADEMARR